MKKMIVFIHLFTLTMLLKASAQTGVNLGNLTRYFMVFTNGSVDANWQSASKGFVGDFTIDGSVASESTSGNVPFAGTIYTSKPSLAAWQNIINSNASQASALGNQSSIIAGLRADLESAFFQINALSVSSGFSSVSSTSLNGLNTVDGVGTTYVINVTSGFSVSSQIKITGDANDYFILRWDNDANFVNGYNGQVKFQSGGAIVPMGNLSAANFIHVAGDINSSGGGSTPEAPYPQGPRKANGTGNLVSGGSDFSGGGFFTGYWLTTGKPDKTVSDLPYGHTASLSNAIFVGGWYSITDKFSMTSGTSGCYVAPINKKGPGSIGDRVWNDQNANGLQDAGEPGLTGVEVKLLNSEGAVIASTTTGSLGDYIFSGLAAGSYKVQFATVLAGSTLSPNNVGNNNNVDSDPSQSTGLTAIITLLPGQDITSIDAGYCPTTLSLGNRVWYDADNNGLLENENGIANVTVQLYKDNDNDDVADGAAIATQKTDANGYYLFQNLVPGNYIVGVTLPNGYTSSAVNGGDPDNNINLDDNGQVLVGNEVRGLAITLISGSEPDGAGDANNSYDFGLLPDCGCTTSSSNLLVNPGFENGTTGWSWNSPNGTLTTGTGYVACGSKNGFNVNNSGTSRVWQDVNITAGSMVTFSAFAGTHTPGKNCSPKLSLIFLNASNTIIGQTDVSVTRDVDVNHDQLEQYTISAMAPAGTVKARVQSSITCDFMKLDAFCLTTVAPPSYTVGNLVWYDINLDGVKDNNEPGIAGIVVNLYDCAGNFLNKTTTTDVKGNYQFSNVLAGTYVAGIVLPEGYSKTDAGVTNLAQDDQNDGATIVGTEVRTTCFTISSSTKNVDFGLKGTSSIGDFVWEDINGNGIQDNGEPGIKGATVKLTLFDNTVLTTTTNATGNYYFNNLPNGTFTLTFTTPQYYTATFENTGSNDNTDSDPINGVTTVVISGTQTNNSYDAGFISDIDDDDDGIIDIVEGYGYDGLKDCDGDGILNYMDLTPGCATPTGVDVYGNPYKPLVFTDCARNGFPNGDGINDFFDFDHDGIINQLDLDSDNDGILDAMETLDAKMVDNNQDGKVDGGDQDRDGLLNSADNTLNIYGGPGLTPQDFDHDGLPNYLDLDSDGDGLSDLTEARGFFDNDGIADGSDTDKDGVNNLYDQIAGSGAKGITLLDTDGDGKVNPYDIDSDDDGITDNTEAQPTCSFIEVSGVDSDGDGMDDAYDTFNNTCILRAPGITPYDKDGDGTPDMYDLDTDNDGAADINEGSGIYENLIFNLSDSDEDGLVDQFDVFNMKTATTNFTHNVAHSNMGTNGSFDGPLPAGSSAKLPKSAPGDCTSGSDRDWRNTTILPVKLVNFNGKLNGGKTELFWNVAGEENMQHYNVERSTDGQSFNIVGQVKSKGNNTLNTLYSLNDDVSRLTSNTIYYRLNMIDKSGLGKYSSLLSFKLNNKSLLQIGLYPNPATSHLQLKINGTKESIALIRMIDMFGKVVLSTNRTIGAGLNTIMLNDLNKIASGTYNIQVVIEGKTLNEKLVIAR